jgi:hypothetical protein
MTAAVPLGDVHQRIGSTVTGEKSITPASLGDRIGMDYAACAFQASVRPSSSCLD